METIDDVKQSTTYASNNQIVFSDFLRDKVISNSIINFKGSNSLNYIRKHVIINLVLVVRSIGGRKNDSYQKRD